MARRSRLTMGAAGLLAAALLAPAASAQGAFPLPTVEAEVAGPCELGGANGTTPMSVVIRDAKGRSKGTFAATMYGSRWSVDCSRTTLQPGDRITLLDGTGGLIRGFRIPAFRVDLDRGRDRITGLAKGVASVDLVLDACETVPFGCFTLDQRSLAVAADGTFRYAPSLNLSSIHHVTLTWVKDGDHVRYQGSFPKLILTQGSAAVGGFGDRLAGALVTDRRGRTVATSAFRVSRTRDLKGVLKRNGIARRVRPGDRIAWSLAGRAQGAFTVPDASMTVGPTSTSGRCFPNRRYWVLSSAPGGSPWRSIHGTAGPDGSFTAEPGYQPGWTVTVECWTRDGDVIRYPGGIVPG